MYIILAIFMPSCQSPANLTIATYFFITKLNIALNVNLVYTNTYINLSCLSLLIL